MNTLKIFRLTRNAIFALLLAGSTFAFANTNPGPDKITEKTREAVAKASPDDWHAYAKAAEKCIRKGVNMDEANQWLEKSLQIKETSYNLSVKGDYFLAKQQTEKALEYYIKSIEVGKAENSRFNAGEIQQKISKIMFK